MATHALREPVFGRWARLGSFLLREFHEVIPPTIFFFFGFNLILLTKRLILAEYLIDTRALPLQRSAP